MHKLTREIRKIDRILHNHFSFQKQQKKDETCMIKRFVFQFEILKIQTVIMLALIKHYDL